MSARKLTHSPFPSPTVDYHAEIDGLRATAVAMIVVYHVIPEFMPGGLIGVDVFFVISGFLITSIIRCGIQERKFAFIEFYSNRARRLLPALTAMLVFCAAFGWRFLLPDEYASLGKHVAGGGTFVSNFILLGESGYFDADSKTKPLLHLWSLGVEAQFYVFWPLVLVILGERMSRMRWFLTLTALSFVFNLWCAAHSPALDYFSPLSRLWEFLAGAALALHPRAMSGLLREQRDALSVCGAVFLGLGMFLPFGHLPYPGWCALLPVGGAVLLIGSGRNALVNRRLLAARPCVSLGLISYPLYIWHWPFISFSRILAEGEPQPFIKVGIVAASIAAAYITYRFVECPVRRGGNKKPATMILCAILVVLVVTGALIFRLEGLPLRPQFRQMTALNNYSYFAGKVDTTNGTVGDFENRLFNATGNPCFTHDALPDFFETHKCSTIAGSDRRKVMLFGDSHAAYLGAYLKDYFQRQGAAFNQFEVASFACHALFINDDRSGCVELDRYISEQIKAIRPDLLIIYANYVSSPNPPPEYVRKIRSYLDLGARRIVIVGQMTNRTTPLPEILARNYLLKGLWVPKRSDLYLSHEAKALDDEMRRMDFGKDVTYVSLREKLCDETACTVRVGSDLKKDVISWDYGHLTLAGAAFVTNAILAPYLREER